VQLPAAAILSFAVHPHLLAREEPLDLSAAADHAGELEQLAEPDGLTANRYVLHQRKLAAAGGQRDCRGAWCGLAGGLPIAEVVLATGELTHILS
jgi:hypothetical protein